MADIRISFHVHRSSTFITAIKPRAKEKVLHGSLFVIVHLIKILQIYIMRKIYFRKSTITFHLLH